MAIIGHSYYAGSLIDGRRDATVKRIVDALRKHANAFDAIACCGMSSCLIAPIVAYLMRKQIIPIRKDGENSHYYGNVLNNQTGLRYIIIDDLVSSGETLEHMTIQASKLNHSLVGLYLYHPIVEITNYKTEDYTLCETEGLEWFYENFPNAFLEYHNDRLGWLG